jgi:hypothetical protein
MRENSKHKEMDLVEAIEVAEDVTDQRQVPLPKLKAAYVCLDKELAECKSLRKKGCRQDSSRNEMLADLEGHHSILAWVIHYHDKPRHVVRAGNAASAH